MDTSSILSSEAIQLKGHKSEILTSRFSPNGELLATAGTDKIINIWQTYSENCKNIITFQNAHSNTITETVWNEDNTSLLSCSVDKSIKLWDIFASKAVRKFQFHSNFINSFKLTCIFLFNNDISSKSGLVKKPCIKDV